MFHMKEGKGNARNVSRRSAGLNEVREFRLETSHAIPARRIRNLCSKTKIGIAGVHPMHRLGLSLLAVMICAFIPESLPASEKPALSPKEQLGKHIFFDTKLSVPEGQSCAACHEPQVGFTGPHAEINNAGAAYEGAVKGRFGNRKPPASSYGGDSPVLHFDKKEKVWVGGMFWDGRATGKRMKDPLAEQAQGPFLNPLEQNIPNTKSICIKIKDSSYASIFEQVWGKGSLDCANNVSATYDRIAKSIAAYERSKEANPFSSKYDYWIRKKVKLSDEEMQGLKLFEGKGKCAECHPNKRGPKGELPPFTDFTYDNLGIPKNPKNPFYSMPAEWNPSGTAFVDTGLGGYLKEAGYKLSQYEPEIGKFKVPTLRNVDKRPSAGFVKAFGHNGYFKTLKEIVHFYNTRDVLGRCEKTGDPKPGVNCWPEPEVASNLNRKKLGNLSLTEKEEEAIVAFLRTLSDG
jgi:cytochrome c peroxidase